MTRQSRPVSEILRDRLAAVGKIAAQNAAHLRLIQIAAGVEIDLLRAARDADAAEDPARMAESDAALARSQELLDALEDELARLDAELAAAANPKDPT